MSAPQNASSPTIRFEATPNPQTMKFVANAVIANGSKEFKKGDSLIRSLLAKKLFGFPWTETVFISQDFVSVTKQEWVDWDTLAEPLAGLIQEHLERGESVLTEEKSQDVSGAEASGTDTPSVQLIKKILNEEIRPAVALDGGDVVFQKYEDKIVYLYMQGSCSGCPSATMTLKEGIATRLRNAIPEILDVVSV